MKGTLFCLTMIQFVKDLIINWGVESADRLQQGNFGVSAQSLNKPHSQPWGTQVCNNLFSAFISFA